MTLRAFQITRGTNTKLTRIKRLIISEIRRLLWTHKETNLGKDDVSLRW